ncbi:MAG: sulfatase-like hydrolase/transferase [bacterium]|nr:sulfatase-like hydrolase/transferase [bacterium]
MDTSQPNVLLILTDQQPVSTLGCYGNPFVQTPAQDRIAKDGMRFDNFYIAAFPCTPSRATLVTGRYTHHHGVVTNDVELDDALPSLGNTFRDAGYNTAWIGKWHLGGQMYRGVEGPPFNNTWIRKRLDNDTDFEFEQVAGGTGEDESRSGFDHWIGGWKHFKSYLQTTDLPEEVKEHPRVGNHNAAPSAPDREHSVSRLGENHHMAHFFADETIQFLNTQKDQDSPFCSVLSFYGPHLPVCPPKPWDEFIPLDQVELPPNFDAPMDNKPAFQSSQERIFVRNTWSREEIRDYIRRYWGYVSYIDVQIQRVLDALKANGQEDNTIVVFTSDHGDMIGQFGMVYKLTYCGYDTLMKVPFMIRWPNHIPAETVNASLASSVDLMPTLLDLAGVSVPEGVDGASMADVLTQKSDTVREEIFTDLMNRGIMLRQGDWKFVLNWKPSTGDWRRPDVTTAGEGNRERDELYHLADDPHEIHNLAYREGHADRVETMKNRILTWLDETGHPYLSTIRDLSALAPSE